MNTPIEASSKAQMADGVRRRRLTLLQVGLYSLATVWLAATAYFVVPALAERSFGPVWTPPSIAPSVDQVAGTYVDETSTLTLRVDGSYEFVADTPTANSNHEIGKWHLRKHVHSSRQYLDLVPKPDVPVSAIVAREDFDLWYERGWFWRARLGVGGDNDNARYLYRQE